MGILISSDVKYYEQVCLNIDAHLFFKYLFSFILGKEHWGGTTLGRYVLSKYSFILKEIS